MINTKQDLVDYCLRELGGGVIEIEVSDEQLEDCVDRAISYYNEFHYEGYDTDYVALKVTATVLEITSTTGIVAGDKLSASNGASAIVKTIIDGTHLDIMAQQIDAKFAVGQAISVNDVVTTNVIVSVNQGVFDNRQFKIDDKSIMAIVRVLNISKTMSSGDYLFSPQYQLMMQEIRSIANGNLSYYFGAMQYLDHLSYVLTKEKNLRFNRRWGVLYLDVDWGSDVKIDDVIILQVNRATNESSHPNMFNDRWLKEYTTAQIKRQWGTNLSKYDNVQLTGGLTYNGKYILESAIQEIEALKEEAEKMSPALLPMIG